MKNIYILCLVILGSCSTVEGPVDMISGASFGSRESRVQFQDDGGKLMKLSYNVGSYDVISGPTYSLESKENNTFIYRKGTDKLTVNVIDTNTVEVIDNEGTKTFSPRGKDLGKRPR